VKFVRIGKWYELSECRRYSVSAVRVDGTYLFDAWRRQPEGSELAPVHLGLRKRVSAARALWEADACTTVAEAA
jgi:hypothetical protein